MTTPTPEALALATAARLAHALDPDGWARCRRCDMSVGCEETGCCYALAAGEPWRCGAAPRWTTLAEAKAEWAAAGGDPERGPALSGRSADGRAEWSVSGPSLTSIRVGNVRVRLWRDSEPGWLFVDSDDDERIETADVIECGRLMAAVDECVRLAEAADGGAK